MSDVSYLTWNRGPRWLPCPSGGPVQIRGLVMCRCVCVDGSVHTAGTSSPTAVTALCYHGSVLCLGGRSGHPAGQPLPTLGHAEFAGDTRLWRGSPGANTGRHPRGGRVSPWFGKGGTSGPPPQPVFCGEWCTQSEHVEQGLFRNVQAVGPRLLAGLRRGQPPSGRGWARHSFPLGRTTLRADTTETSAHSRGHDYPHAPQHNTPSAQAESPATGGIPRVSHSCRDWA